MLRKYVRVQGSQSVLRHCTAALPDMHSGLQGMPERWAALLYDPLQHKCEIKNDHTTSVQSRSGERLYTVSLPQDASTEASTCTCQAGVHRRMCWHVAKVLLLLGYSEHALLRHMGLFKGSDKGGY